MKKKKSLAMALVRFWRTEILLVSFVVCCHFGVTMNSVRWCMFIAIYLGFGAQLWALGVGGGLG
jgi:hypothetical protein